MNIGIQYFSQWTNKCAPKNNNKMKVRVGIYSKSTVFFVKKKKKKERKYKEKDSKRTLATPTQYRLRSWIYVLVKAALHWSVI